VTQSSKNCSQQHNPQTAKARVSCHVHKVIRGSQDPDQT
jgi:hypothetical protein